MLITFEQTAPHQILLNRSFVWSFQTLIGYLSEGDKVHECYSCSKLIIQAHLNAGFFKIFFLKIVLFKRFYWYMQLLESSKIFKQRNNHEVPCDKNCMKKKFA